MPSKRLWDASELAEHLNVPKSWVYERTRQNGPEVIPHMKLGKYIRFDPESEGLQGWIRAHQIGSLGSTPNGDSK